MSPMIIQPPQKIVTKERRATLRQSRKHDNSPGEAREEACCRDPAFLPSTRRVAAADPWHGLVVDGSNDHEVPAASAVLGKLPCNRGNQRASGKFQTRAQVIYRDCRKSLPLKSVLSADRGQAGVYPAPLRVVTQSDSLPQEFEDRRDGLPVKRRDGHEARQSTGPLAPVSAILASKAESFGPLLLRYDLCKKWGTRAEKVAARHC
jgi:hypothetical protein